MKSFFLSLSLLLFYSGMTQTLQLHYDPRHSIDPANNSRNFCTMYFEYFKNQDSGKGFIKPGSFLLKTQADFLGQQSNIGKVYLQASQSFRCWKPKIFLNLQYSGGLGITEPRQYSYYILNTYSVGVTYPFTWQGAYLSAVINYKYVPYNKASNDFLYTLYWWKGLFNYKLELSGDFSVWTENKNHGDALTKDLKGKRFFFFAEPQLWYNLNKIVAAGTRINVYYHVLSTANEWNIYPSFGVRCKL